MYRSKDFEYMKVVDPSGKSLGSVKDLLIDFHNSELKGVQISSMSLFSRSQQVQVKDIISINKVMIVNGISKGDFLSFKILKDMEVYNGRGELLGVIEDLLIDKRTFSVNGIIISSGLIHKLIYGKSIILPKSCILAEDFLIHIGDERRIKLLSLPHKGRKEVK